MIFQSDQQTYYGPVPWWVLTGTLTRDEIVRQLDELSLRNIKEVFLYANYGLEKPDFLSEEWFECVDFMIGEFAKRKMAFWIYDELSWPSGSAGGMLPRDYPEYRMRSLTNSEKLLAPGEKIELPAGDMVRWCGVFYDKNAEPQELAPGETFVNSQNQPATVVVLEVKLIESVFFHNIGTESTWNQIGTLDTLNPAAVKCWMNYIHEEYRKRFKQYFGSIIKGFFFDEPTMSALDKTNTVPWTWDLEEAFQQKYGYDCRPHYWKLFRQPENAGQFRYDFWLLAGNRFAEAFARQLSDWCSENDLMLTGHGWPEEPSCQRLMINSTGDLHFQQQYLQVPGTDYLQLANCYTENITMGAGAAGWARNYIFSTKHPSSTARYNGTARTLVECSMICGFNSPLSLQRWCFDYHFAMGLNLINSGVAFSLRDFRKYACCAESAMPYWKYYRHLSDYIERSSYFNCRGWQATDIAVLNAVSGKFAASDIAFDTSMRNEKTPFAEGADSAPATLATLEALVRSHREFELLFEEVLIKGKVADGVINLPNSQFKVIIIPQSITIESSVAEKLAEFVKSGGKVIAIGDRPQKLVYGVGNNKDVDLNKIVTHQLDHSCKDFPQQLQTLLNLLTPELYTVSGSGSEDIITLLRQDGDWFGLWVYNATAGDKNLTLKSQLGFNAVLDPGYGEYHQLPTDGKFTLQEGQSLLFIADKTLPVKALPAFDRAVWQPLKKSYTLPLQWSYSEKPLNTMRPSLEIMHGGEFIAIPSDGYCPFVLDPDRTPMVTLRGKFVIAGNSVPDDLRLRFDSENFSELVVNGKVVNQAAVPVKVFDESNRAVYIAGFCHNGENIFTVNIPVSKWYGERYGICRHFTGLIHLLEIVPLAGSFALNENGGLTALPETFHAGDLGLQGLSQFGGTLKLHTQFDLPSEALAKNILGCTANHGTIELKLNGVELPLKLWQYGNFALPEKLLKSSGNTLEMVITHPLGNLYPRRWNGAEFDYIPFMLPEFYL